jgi:diguanylate cyclase (GGDEF)-like protein
VIIVNRVLSGLLPRAGRIAAAAAGTALAAHALWSLGVIEGHDELFNVGVYDGLIALAAAVCLGRAVFSPVERTAWAVLGTGLASWTAGEISWSIYLSSLESPPYPSVADGFYLGFYALSYVALLLLLRSRARGLDANVWLDGLTAALAVAAAGAAILFEAVLAATGGSASAVATNLAYPLADILLISLVFGVFALTGWRPGRVWAFLGAGFAVTTVADGIYLYEASSEVYIEGTILDTLWPASALLLALAAWQRLARPRRVRVEGRRLLVVPTAFGLVGLGVLAYDHVSPVNDLAFGLALATLLVVTARAGLTFRENYRMLERIGMQVVTDQLTGLGNRRRLLDDLDEVADGPAPTLLLLFDLDGFKAYNDTYGHPAGDELLARLGRKLTAALPPGATAYRLGGDEFCALVPRSDEGSETVLDGLAAALVEHGDAFDVSSSFGAVFLPDETRSASHALRIADERLYAQKQRKRLSAGSQSQDVLLRVLYEREPELHEHVRGVARHAVAVGRLLGLGPEDLDDLARAAELHDVGKLAIPDAILRKPGPLDEHERRFVEQHTIVGERILCAAPALLRVARIVRSTHERWDGNGYPDGLAGEEIPLGARIIAVCDSYSSMTDERPYGEAVDHERALAEIRRCAGSQFDPQVVEAFAAACAEGAVERVAA